MSVFKCSLYQPREMSYMERDIVWAEEMFEGNMPEGECPGDVLHSESVTGSPT